MTKVTLAPVGSLIDVTTAQTTINNNNAAIVAAVENTLSRDGTGPNQINATLDMNSNRITNLPIPIGGSEPLRLQDATLLNGGGTIQTVPSGGTTGSALTKNSGTNYDIGWTPPTGTGNIVKATSPTLVTPVLGTPTSVTLTNGTGLPITTGVSGLGSNVATFLASPTSSNLISAMSDETGTGNLVFNSNATLTSPTINTATLTSPTISSPTLTGTVNVSGLTASSTVQTDGSKNLVSVANTGTGNNVLSTSAAIITPTITTPVITGFTDGSSAASGKVGEYLEVKCPNPGNTATVTMTIAAPAVVTWTAHPYTAIGTTSWTAPIVFTTTGALPTGVTAGTTYWVIGSTVTTNTFQIATSAANAIAGTAITTTGSQSGVQTGTCGATLTTGSTFNVAAFTLPAGDWTVGGVGAFLPNAATSITQIVSSITTVSAGNGSFPQIYVSTTPATVWGANQGMAPLIPSRVSVSSNTIYYVTVNSTFTVNANTGFGMINARRVR